MFESRTAFRLVIVCVSLIGFCGCSRARTESHADATTVDQSAVHRIRALNTAMEDAFRTGDMASVSAFYADNAILIAPGGRRVEGREAIDAYWGRYGAGVSDRDWTLTIDRTDGDRGVYVQHGTSTLRMTRNGEEPRTSIVSFVLVWEETRDGSLKITVDAYW